MSRIDEMDKAKFAVWCYGSNLLRRQMMLRCPSNKPMDVHVRQGYKLEFRGVANVHKTKDGSGVCHGAIYYISERDLYNLDRFEGYNTNWPKQSKYVRLSFVTEQYGTVYYYVMNRGFPRREPRPEYYGKIVMGYKAWGLPYPVLENALDEAQSYEASIFSSATRREPKPAEYAPYDIYNDNVWRHDDFQSQPTTRVITQNGTYKRTAIDEAGKIIALPQRPKAQSRNSRKNQGNPETARELPEVGGDAAENIGGNEAIPCQPPTKSLEGSE